MAHRTAAAYAIDNQSENVLDNTSEEFDTPFLLTSTLPRSLHALPLTGLVVSIRLSTSTLMLSAASGETRIAQNCVHLTTASALPCELLFRTARIGIPEVVRVNRFTLQC